MSNLKGGQSFGYISEIGNLFSVHYKINLQVSDWLWFYHAVQLTRINALIPPFCCLTGIMHDTELGSALWCDKMDSKYIDYCKL